MRFSLLGVVAAVSAAVAFLPACSEAPTQAQVNAKVAAFFGNKTTKQVESGLITLGLNAGTAALEQYATTGKVDTTQLGANAIYGGIALIRSLQATPQAASPAAITTAISQGSADDHIAAVITPTAIAGITQAVSKGVPPDKANEQMAVGLETAAANPPGSAP